MFNYQRVRELEGDVLDLERLIERYVRLVETEPHSGWFWVSPSKVLRARIQRIEAERAEQARKELLEREVREIIEKVEDEKHEVRTQEAIRNVLIFTKPPGDVK